MNDEAGRQTSKLQIEEIIVVEGIHDKQAVDRVCDADIWVIGGDRIAKSFLSALQRAAAARGIIILTDPDGAGNRIRQRLLKAVPSAKQAFIARAAAAGHGGLGVEHASDDAIRQALAAAKPTASQPYQPLFSMADMYAADLAGSPNAVQRRQQVGDILGIGSGNAKAFLKKLNTLRITKEQWQDALGNLS